MQPPEPPYGQPQQPYGQPQQPYGQPYYGSGGYPPPPVKPRNGFAVAGIILAVLVWPLGLIFSIIGVAKSNALAGAGKALSIVGIVVSLVVGAGAIAIGIQVAHSTAADPACITAENDGTKMGNTFNADSAAIRKDQSNPSALRTDLQKFLNDLQSLQSQLTSAQAQARHQSVKTRIAALSSDISTFRASLQAVQNGNLSQAGQMNSAMNKFGTDGNALDSTCSSL